MRFSILFLSVSLVWLAACAKKEGAGAAKVAPLAFETIDLEQTYGVCDEPDTSCASITIEFPEITAAPTPQAKDSINAYIRKTLLGSIPGDKPVENVEAAMSRFIDDYKKFKVDFPDYPTSWSVEREVKVYYQDAGLASLSFYEFSYTGGAHPNSAVHYATFDLQNGNRITLKDLFTEGFQERLNNVAEKRFRELKAIAPNQTYADAGFWFENEQFKLTGNFAVGDTGVVFYYNNYEIAPYAMGPTELGISYRDLKELIDPTGPLAKKRGE